MELTESIDCPEGLIESPTYNFYQVEREFTPTEDDLEVTLL
jgi:hypothetical protein